MKGNKAKRKDKKGRLLRPGESQRKDGRYQFTRYVNGKRMVFYSWKLEARDRIPSGKHGCQSLREKEEQLTSDLRDGIRPGPGLSMTVAQLLDRFDQQRAIERDSTEQAIHCDEQIIKKTRFSAYRVSEFYRSDAKIMLKELQNKYHYSYGTIRALHSILRRAFQILVDDDLIRKNPFDFSTAEVVVNDSKAKVALTKEQEKEYLDFVRHGYCHGKYYPAIYLLFHTGIRVGELSALTLSDIHWDEGYLDINKQAVKIRNRPIYIDVPKSSNGVRHIPLTEGTRQALKDIVNARTKIDDEAVVCSKDGSKEYRGFLFTARVNDPDHTIVCKNSASWGLIFYRIYDKFMKYHNYKPGDFPPVHPHITRHTFSTLRGSLLPAKVHMQIMGHSNLNITYRVYTHDNDDLAKEAVRDRIHDDDYMQEI